MAKTKVLITVKTYPTLSSKYEELVCTAGFLEDGSWIRIYPIPFRKLNYQERYSKWQWVEFDLVKNSSDFRPESYRPVDWERDIILGEKLDTSHQWAKRREIALKKVYTDMAELIEDARNPDKMTSLAVFKPTEVLDFVFEPCDRDWDEEKIKRVYESVSMGNLFDTEEERIARENFKIVDKIPYEFSYIFTSSTGKRHKLMIEDWEVGALYRRYINDYHKSETEACEMVKRKFFEDFAKTKDLYFFLGTTKRYHNYAKNPFIIIGTFTPPLPKITQPSLFDM